MGFILAAAGSAIGVGNIWRFPYMMGENGGFWFLVVYLVLVIFLGIPVMIGEISIGRATALSPVAAFQKIHKGPISLITGILAIIAPLVIMTYYGIIGGWGLKYMFSFIGKTFASEELVQFGPFINGAYTYGLWQPVFWTIAFLLIAFVVCLKGTAGIELANKILTPGLCILLVVVMVRAMTLPGAMEGIKYMFLPSPERMITLRTIPDALGQCFFSLSLAMGAMITYGSYCKKSEDIPYSATVITGLDTVTAVMAGVAIFPAVFAMGASPAGGVGLTFITLPHVFDKMPLGDYVGIFFFLCIVFAALASAISLLETCSAFAIDSLKWTRTKAVVIMTIGFCILSIPNSMSLADVNSFAKPLNVPGNPLGCLFDVVDFFANNIVLPIGGALTCIVIGYLWKMEKSVAEIESTPGYVFSLRNAYGFCIKILGPVLLIVVLVSQFMGK
jgi:NSS family neurotransmitter:Na+ symporter